MDKRDTSARVIINSITVAILFCFVIAVCVAGLLLLSTRGEFLAAVRGEIGVGVSFYVPALLLIAMSSVLYTPFSYGISAYFLNSLSDSARLSQVFYLFRTPRILLKAITINFVKMVITLLKRILVLVIALVVECAVFVLFVVLCGDDVFEYEHNFLQTVADNVFKNPFFIIVTALEWMAVCVAFIYIKIRYIMCKYLLMLYNSMGVLECIRISRYVTKQKAFAIMLTFVKHIARNIYSLFRPSFKPRGNFSSYAMELCKTGFERYCKVY